MRPQHSLPPYPLEVSLVDRCCHGKITVQVRSIGCTQTERFHNPPVGQPPFIEVSTYRFGNSEYYDTNHLVGFISPTIEFLGEEGTYDLLNSLGEMFSTRQAAEILKLSPRYLEKLRRLGEGPKFWRIAEGGCYYQVWYELRDIEAYAGEQRTRPERRGGRRERQKQKVYTHEIVSLHLLSPPNDL